jgi:hypothetical protein
VPPIFECATIGHLPERDSKILWLRYMQIHADAVFVPDNADERGRIISYDL